MFVLVALRGAPLPPLVPSHERGRFPSRFESESAAELKQFLPDLLPCHIESVLVFGPVFMRLLYSSRCSGVAGLVGLFRPTSFGLRGCQPLKLKWKEVSIF